MKKKVNVKVSKKNRIKTKKHQQSNNPYLNFKGAWFWIMVVLVIILLSFFIWANFFYYKPCENTFCFEDYLKDCQRARFISAGDINMEYLIQGKVGDKCRVVAKLRSADLSIKDSEKLVGKEMTCEFQAGLIIYPENQINLCHGLLKEGLQDLLIDKLHKYIIQNIEEIA